MRPAIEWRTLLLSQIRIFATVASFKGLTLFFHGGSNEQVDGEAAHNAE